LFLVLMFLVLIISLSLALHRSLSATSLSNRS
jgi:hypothetical protein